MTLIPQVYHHHYIQVFKITMNANNIDFISIFICHLIRKGIALPVQPGQPK